MFNRYMMFRKPIFLLLLLFINTASAATLRALSVNEGNNKVMLTCSLSAPFSYKAFILENPARVVIDFQQTKNKADLSHLPKGRHLIARIRTGYPQPHTLRVVVDMQKPVQIKVRESARALNIELIPSAVSTPKASVTQSDAKPSNDKKNEVGVVRSPSKALRDVVVVVDPGHGGKDPGAVGPRHHLEKNVVLAMALNLKKIIDKEPGMRAVLTRSGDYYVGLRERLNIARKHDADVFISLHADAFINKNSHGASVFALSPTGATSEAARWLAEKENYSELGGVNLSELDDKNGMLRSVLIDLSQTATIGASLDMGASVLTSLDKITTLHHEAVEQARFVVLKSPDIPSVLIETGFISNPREEKNLSSPAYQIKLSQAIFSGLKAYFFSHPPHGTHIEAMAGRHKYLVRKGDTLSELATRYHISLTALKKANRLNHDKLLQGQTLTIPKA